MSEPALPDASRGEGGPRRSTASTSGRKLLRTLLRTLLYAWASPVTLVGLLLALLVRATGGTVRRVAGVVEASGGLLGGLFPRIHPRLHLLAVTLGHVVLAEHEESAERSRAHERVHVAQYERWGLLFPFLYFGSSAWALLTRRDPYRDNAFEREAFLAGLGEEGRPRGEGGDIVRA